MQIIALVPLIIAIVGALVYALATNAKVSTLGLWTYVVGAFWFVSTLVHVTAIRIG